MSIQLSISFTLFIIFILMSTYWIIVLLKRIYCFKKYQRGLARLITNEDSDSINKQYYYHYETNINQSFYLIAMALLEVCGLSAYLGEIILVYYYGTTGKYKLYINSLDQCRNLNNTLLEEFQVFESSIPYITTLRALAVSLALYLAIVAVSLMNYLTKRHLKATKLTGRINCRQLFIVTAMISVLQITSSYFTTFIDVSKIITLLIMIPYYIIVIKTVNQYKNTLLQKALERLAQYGSNRDELNQYKYFKYTANIICLGSLLLMFAQVVLTVRILLTNIVFFETCFFPFNIYNLFSPFGSLQNNIQMGKLQALRYLSIATRLIALSGICIAISPFVLVTTRKWIKYAYKLILGKSEVTFRYNLVDSNTAFH